MLLTQYFSGDQMEKNGIGGGCSTYGERRGLCRVLVGKPEGKRPLGRPKGRKILRWIFGKWDVGLWTGSSRLRIGTGGGQL